MKNRLLIGIFLTSLILIAGCKEDVKKCETDSDCIIVTDGCCDCNAMGKATTINNKSLEYWKEENAGKCKGTLCFMAISNDPTCFAKPKCVNNECVLKNLCEIGKEYKNNTIRPVTCECPEGYELESSMGWTQCPDKSMMDCAESTLKCVEKI